MIEKLVALVVAVTYTTTLVECIAVPAGTCVDIVACDRYSPEMCTDPEYYSWKTEHCPAYCGICSQLTQGSHVGVGRFMDSGNVESGCKDAISNCADYGTALCGDVKFYNWANENCRAHCKRCSTTCKDETPICAEYGTSICTNLSYYNWVEMNCRKFCARCTS